eukprot:jgi/Tetstr1/442271/TSEL_030412.t1
MAEEAPRTVVQSIAACVARQPEAAALLYWDGQPSSRCEAWSYAELWAAAQAGAKVLRGLMNTACGKGSDAVEGPLARVGVMLADGPGLPLLELATLCAGCVVVPLDLADAVPRLAFVLRDAQPALIVVQDEAGAARAEEAMAVAGGSAVVRLVEEVVDAGGRGELVSGAEEDGEEGERRGGPRLEGVSHIFFTSGSTGRPKGCVSTHRSLAHFAAAKNAAHGITSGDVVFVASSHTFDPSLGDLVSAWCAGASAAMASRASTFASLGNCLAECGATHLTTTPSLFSTLAATGWAPDRLPSLQVVALGGEHIPRSIAQAWAGAVTLINTYGVTECCVYQAYCVVPPGGSPSQPGPPAGRRRHAAGRGQRRRPDAADSICGPVYQLSYIFVVHCMSLHSVIVTAARAFTATDTPTASSTVGLGYLGRPDLTAARFVDHPRLGRLFRTGDIATAGPRGWELVGRRDSQVKIAGKRVELSEIEEVLLATARGGAVSLLQGVAVVLSRQAGGRPLLVAWCVPAAEEKEEEGEDAARGGGGGDYIGIDSGGTAAGAVLEDLLRLLARRHLPPHMVPARCVFVSELPTTPNGKVARSALAGRELPATGPRRSGRWAAADGGGARQDGEEGHGGGGLWAALADTGGWGAVARRARSWAAPWTPTAAAPTGPRWGGDSLAALRCCQALAAELRAARAAAAGMGAGTQAAAAPEEGGVFGELLGPLAPAELLQRPRLADFARHLTQHLGAFPGHEAAAGSGGTAIGIKAVAAPGASQPSGDAGRITALLEQASAAGAASVVAFLVGEEGADPDGEPLEGVAATPAEAAAARRQRHSPLHIAAASQQAGALRALLAAGASAGMANRAGVQPLHVAARQGPPEAITALLEAGASLSARDTAQQTVWALLLERWLGGGGGGKKGGGGGAGKGGRGGRRAAAAGGGQAGVDPRDHWGRTPLHWAVVNGHQQAVAALLEAGASAKAVDSAGETPLAVAERRAQCGANDRGGARASVFGAIATTLGGSAKTVRGDKGALFAGAGREGVGGAR